MSKETKRILLQIILFIVTFISATFAGAEWAFGVSIYSYDDDLNFFINPNYTFAHFQSGLPFSISLLLILTVHEFGHYFTALFHKVKTSLPYYIPIPPIPYLPLVIGTLGAVIRLRSRPRSNVENFDIGLAGPLSGFIVALFILAYGFMTLPPGDYVFQFHPEYKEYGANYAEVVYSDEFLKGEGNVIDIKIGTNLIFLIFGELFGDPSRIPNAHELMHYPLLLGCYLALFFTSLNLLPIGQLDGGHVVYGLFGFRIHNLIASLFFLALMFYSGLGLEFIDPRMITNADDPKVYTFITGVAGYLIFLFLALKSFGITPARRLALAISMATGQITLMYFVPGVSGFPGFLLFGLLVGRLVGISYPKAELELPLDTKRVVLGWITLLVFILCFNPVPIAIAIR